MDWAFNYYDKVLRWVDLSSYFPGKETEEQRS